MAHTAETYRRIYHLISQDLSYRQIAQDLKVSKNTVQSVNDRFNETGSIYPSNIIVNIYDPYFQTLYNRIEYFSSLTKPSYKKFHRLPLGREEILDHIRKEFPTLSTSNFNYLYRLVKNKNRESYLTIHYNPADIVQFDWGYLTMNLNDHNRKIYFAVFVHPYSLMQFGFVAHKETAEHFNIAYHKYLLKAKKVAHQLLIDNMKIAKRTHDPTVTDRNLTHFFEALSNHYKFQIRFCAPNQPNQKGAVELGVKAAKKIIIDSGETEFKSLEHIQRILDEGFKALNEKKHPHKNNSRLDLFKEEHSLMKPLPIKPFTFFFYDTRRVIKKTSMVSLHATRYEVPEYYRGETVTIKHNRQNVYILDIHHKIIAKYKYSTKKNNIMRRIWYTPDKLRTKHRGFEDSYEYHSMPNYLKNIYHHVYKQNPIEFAAFLNLAKNRPKDFLKKALRRNTVSIHDLTENQLLTELNRNTIRYKIK
ncbi:DDE-type integrase/transposase/recombinase [Fusibacter tunisiensis]|uniref:Integrase catalytic domain-containing protein n=1 Tax=Fusibacter tunisiensis TaxID=1008308 RepID=A0ABS2MNB6_9FIRM|nr:DDE-type integrase/transposase/recombinase [Fusibacter tunisiensis]MBM7560886.1 hypothetical protein [Fusibacter tunisiensis]